MIPDDAAELIDLAGRIMLTHAIDPGYAARVLGIEHRDAVAMVACGRIAVSLDEVQHDRLRVFVNILLRLECRLGHDSRAIRSALEAPLAACGGMSPADLLAGSIDDLRTLRRAVETIERRKERWWRVGH